MDAIASVAQPQHAPKDTGTLVNPLKLIPHVETEVADGAERPKASAGGTTPPALRPSLARFNQGRDALPDVRRE